MPIEGIKVNCQEVRNANVTEIAGLYDLVCFKRWPGHRSNDIIDAGWVVTLKVIEAMYVLSGDLQYGDSRTSSNIWVHVPGTLAGLGRDSLMQLQQQIRFSFYLVSTFAKFSLRVWHLQSLVHLFVLN